MDNHTFQIIYDLIVRYESFSYLMIFIVTLLEATIFIGLIIPAGLILIALGFISQGGYLDAKEIVALAIAGALVGDILNYGLGKFHTKKREIKKIEEMEELLKKKSYLEYGKHFFKKHGGKSVFLGRFIGMTRPFIAFTAGTSQMRFSKFMYFNIASAVLWILLYFEIGYIFGSSMELILSYVKRAGDLTLIIVLALLLFLYVRAIFNQRYKPKVVEKSNKILEKIDIDEN